MSTLEASIKELILVVRELKDEIERRNQLHDVTICEKELLENELVSRESSHKLEFENIINTLRELLCNKYDICHYARTFDVNDSNKNIISGTKGRMETDWKTEYSELKRDYIDLQERYNKHLNENTSKKRKAECVDEDASDEYESDEYESDEYESDEYHRSEKNNVKSENNSVEAENNSVKALEILFNAKLCGTFQTTNITPPA